MKRKMNIEIITYCYPGDVDNKEKARALLEYVGFDITEIDPPEEPSPNKKIPCFSFMVEMNKACIIIDLLNAHFVERSVLRKLPLY